MDGTGDHHAERDKPSCKIQNITSSCSFVEPRTKIMMVMMVVVVIAIIGHECIWGMVWGDQREEGRGKERVLCGEKDGSMLHIYE
jgi:hypothetical protein